MEKKTKSKMTDGKKERTGWDPQEKIAWATENEDENESLRLGNIYDEGRDKGNQTGYENSDSTAASHSH